jgi:hypothetical protein
VYINTPATELGTSTSQHYTDLVRFERGIQTLLHDLTTGQALRRSAELLRLADQLSQHTQQEEAIDIDVWARRVADDVARLTD